MLRYLILLSVIIAALAVETPMHLYKKNENKVYQKVLVPVSSTVIALDDLPQYKVVAGFGVKKEDANGRVKPEGEIKLITVNSKRKKPINEKKEYNKKTYQAVAVEEFEN